MNTLLSGILRVKSGLDFSAQLNAEETLAAEAEGERSMLLKYGLVWFGLFLALSWLGSAVFGLAWLRVAWLGWTGLGLTWLGWAWLSWAGLGFGFGWAGLGFGWAGLG